MPTAVPASPENRVPAQRLLSLDAFRGADMLCILGLDALAWALAQAFPQSGFCKSLALQFGHKPWEGLALYDCVFPAFVFISGMAMAFSFEKKRERGDGNAKIALSLLRRALILVALGAILQGALSFDAAGTRFASVLGLIGVANAIGGLLALFLKTPKKIFAALLAVSAAVSCAQIFGGDFGQGGAGTLNAKLDALLLPGKFHNGAYDPEGVLCVASASVSVLAGFLAGLFVRRRDAGKATRKTAGTLAGIGVALVAAAFAAGTFYPVVKNIWTQTFVFAATGWSLVAFSVFYALFDVLKLGKAAFFFKIVGVNAIAIYVLKWIFPFDGLSRLLFGGVAGFFGNAAPVVIALGVILLEWLFLLWLFRRKIFFKI